MITIYDKNNAVRVKLHVDDGSAVQAVYDEDAALNQEISNEEFVTIRVTSVIFISFQVGDYLEVYGNTYRLKKIPAPIDKNGSNRFEYTLKFESNRADLAEVNLQLFDNTTVGVVPAYNPATTYSQGYVVSYHTLHWQYINAIPSAGNTPAENDYWALKSTVTNYVPTYNPATTYTYGNIVDYNNNYYMHIGTTDTVGVVPMEGEHWTVVKTAPMWDFSTILTPTRYAQLIVDNMNRARPNQTWTVGYCIPAEPKETTFSNVKCLEACSSIAELFETEFWVDGYSVNFGKRSNATAITMAYGKGNGFKKVTRNEVTESRKVTRLIALGAEKNLLGTYRNGSKRLMLPNKYYLDSSNIDLSSPMEDTQTWDDVYPTMQHATEDYNNTTTYYVGNQVLYSGYSWDCILQCTGIAPAESYYWKYSEGTVTTSVGQYKLIDKNITFDPLGLDVRMKDGTIPKIKFFTGNLAGYEFPITGYITDTKQITIQQISDSTDSLLPTASYGFKAGDRFGFVDLYMPSTYVQKAENRLLAKAQEFLDKYSVDQVSYAGEVDEIWATQNEVELKIGDIIHFNDANFGISLDYRIVKITRNLTRAYKYTIELSTLPYIPSKITTITNKITQNETYIEYNGLNTKMSRSKTFLGAREAIDMAFDPSGDYFTDKIKPLIVETSALLVGVQEQQFSISELNFKTIASNPNKITWDYGVIINSKIESNSRTWNIASGEFNSIDSGAAYYCYIKCERNVGSTLAIVLFDIEQHTTEEEDNYYYFLLGSLTSVINGMRQLYTSKGFTFINGDTIVTGRIQSENGEVDIDLANETMHFGNTEKYIDYRDGAFKVKGNLVVSPSGIEFPMSCFRGEYNVSYAYYKGDEVTYLGSSYICIDNAPAGILPTNTGWWQIKSSKGDTGEGIDGGNTAIIYLYQRSASAPSLGFTNNLTYTFSTKTLSGNIGTWSKTIPSGSNPLYVIAATAYSNTDTDTIAYTEWSTPEILASNGTDGLNSATVHLYKRLSSIPAVPSTALTYTFATGLLSGNLYGWTQGMPASDGNPCYVTLATAVSVNATDSILSTEWNTPVILVEDGTSPVTIQITGKNIFKYHKNSTTPENTSVTLTANVQGLASPDYEWGYIVGTTFTSWGIYTQTREVNVSALGASESLKVRCYTNGGLQYDDYTLYKLYDGTDTINVILSNESHTVACYKDGTPKNGEFEKAMTVISVYRGATLLSFGFPSTGWDIDEFLSYGASFIQSDDSIQLQSFNTGSNSGYCDITVIVGSLYITKRFTVAKSIDGQTGTTGNYFEHRYAVNGSTTSAPPINVSSSDPSIVVGEITYTWSLTLPTQGLMEYTWMTTAEKTSAGALVTNWSAPQRITGVQGETGDSGPAMSYKGVWNSSVQYIGNSLVVNVVKYGTTYYIARVDAGVIPAGTSTSNTTFWNSIGANFESVATGLLLAQSAYIENLIVSQLATSANPYAARFANIGTGVGIFKNKAQSTSIYNAIISMGKDIAQMQTAGEKKPALSVRDVQWHDEPYSNSITYFKDDRVYYNDPTYHGTYIFTYEWQPEDADEITGLLPTGIIPTNENYWYKLSSRNLGGGRYSEIGSEGVFSNGSNINGFSSASGYVGNSSGVYLLNKHLNEFDTSYGSYIKDVGISSAVLGIDQAFISPTIWTSGTSYVVGNKVYYNSKFYNCILATNSAIPTNTTYWEEYISSQTYGGWFNTLYAGSLRRSCRRVSTSQTLTKFDSIIHCDNTAQITLTLPVPDKSMIGMELRIRVLGTNTVTISTPNNFLIWYNTETTNYNINNNDTMMFTWDGVYWVTSFMQES